MLITTVGINNQREQHMISTIKTVHLTDGINLLEDGEGKYYISYKLHEMNRIRKVYIGWSKTKPIPGSEEYDLIFEKLYECQLNRTSTHGYIFIHKQSRPTNNDSIK